MKATRAKRTTPRFCATTALAVVALLVAAADARAQTKRAATLAEYRARIERSASSLDALAALTQEAAAVRGGESWARFEVVELLPDTRESTLREVRSLVPPVEQVRGADGGTHEVDNRWLHSGLDEYERLPAYSSNESAPVDSLEGLVGRLRSLAARVSELEGASVSGAKRDKEAEKGRLAAILRGPDFAAKDARGSALSRIIDSLLVWLRELLRKLLPEWGPLQPGAGGEGSTVAQVIIYALAAAAIVFVARAYWRRRGSGKKRAPERGPRVILGERLAPDQTASDLLEEAERLARLGNLRGAIRKAYIALLCELADRRVVRLAQHKTNRDYLQSVRKSSPQTYDLFRPLTLNFERHWYGSESATEEDWDDFRTRCRRALETN